MVAYSIAYPAGVTGMMLALFAMQKRFAPDLAAEASALGISAEELVSRSVVVEHSLNLPLREWRAQQHWRVVFGRVQRGQQVERVSADWEPRAGDIVTVVGAPSDVAEVAAALGHEHTEHLSADHSVLDFRRVFVSEPGLAGRRLSDLRVHETLGATITRVRRGDRDIVPDGQTVLELGDRLRVVAARERMAEISRYFGDSYRRLSEIDLMTFSLGLVLGLLLGAVPLPLPGGGSFSLGVAGGRCWLASCWARWNALGRWCGTFPIAPT
ncbi:TrkA C-terminal domain-containing protein [Deinococcus lacus]|uniref:TrkA C-terminal domain-containing protein n=1 Tax=Deinococcus lacus TaxID=392561 RepID=A0ABW1YAB3_9DEIO